MCTALAPAPLHTALRYRQTDTQTDRRGQAAAIPASPAQNNSRRLDSDQVFPQALFDMNIKGASQIPSTVRGLENPCCRASRPSSPMRRAKPTPSTAPGTPAPLPFPEDTASPAVPLALPGTEGCWRQQAALAGSRPLLQALACCPWGWEAEWVWRQQWELGEVFTWLPGQGGVRQAASRRRTQAHQESPSAGASSTDPSQELLQPSRFLHRGLRLLPSPTSHSFLPRLSAQLGLCPHTSECHHSWVPPSRAPSPPVRQAQGSILLDTGHPRCWDPAEPCPASSISPGPAAGLACTHVAAAP